MRKLALRHIERVPQLGQLLRGKQFKLRGLLPRPGLEQARDVHVPVGHNGERVRESGVP